MRLAVYDIDGTLTEPGYPFWDSITSRVIAGKNNLRQYLEEWEQGSSARDGMKEEEFIKVSKEMMERCLRLDPTLTAACIRHAAKDITKEYCAKRIVIYSAIEQLKRDVQDGFNILLSTGSYFDGAIGFLEGLVAAGLLNDDDVAKIHVRGCTVNWLTKEVTFMNVGNNKSNTGLDLGVYKHIKVYGDDPFGNDIGLFNLTDDLSDRFVIPGKIKASSEVEGFAKLHAWPS